MAKTVLDVDNVEGTHMSLSRRDNTNTTQIVTTSHHAQVAGLELDRVNNLARGNVVAD